MSPPEKLYLLQFRHYIQSKKKQITLTFFLISHANLFLNVARMFVDKRFGKQKEIQHIIIHLSKAQTCTGASYPKRKRI